MNFAANFARWTFGLIRLTILIYSFFFREFRGEKSCLCGGLILHGQEDMSKAYYGIHT